MVRPLVQVLPKILAHVIVPVAPRTFRTSEKLDARRFLERLLNQNEQTLGLFFLYPDTDAGIAEPAVAFLRVSIALRSEHYDVLRSSRTGRLTAEFRAKPGWLTGNLYHRPATLDWSETADGKTRCDALIKRSLEDARWLDDEIVDAAKASGIDLNSDTQVLEDLRPRSRLDRAIDEVKAELGRVAPDLSDEILKKFGNRLRNNGKFKKLFRR